MNLEGKLDAAFLEDVEDRVPAVGEELEALVDHRVRHRRKRVQQVPDRRAGETVDDLDAQSLGGPGGVFHLLDRPLGLLLGVAPDGGGHPVVGAGVVVVEHELAGQVVGDGPALEPVLAEKLMTPLAIVGLVSGLSAR